MADELMPNPLEAGDLDVDETNEWLESLEGVLEKDGPERARYLLGKLLNLAHARNVAMMVR